MDTITRDARPVTAPAIGTAGGAPARAAQPTPTEIEETIARLGQEIGRNAGTEAVFGQPRAIGERTIIPVARIAYGFGGGAAPGLRNRHARTAGKGSEPPTRTPAEATATAGAGAAPADGLPSGFGGGGGVRAEPVAVIEIGPQGMRVVPIVDVSRLVGRVLTAVFAFGGVALVVRALAGRRRPAPPRAAGGRAALAWPRLAWLPQAALVLRLIRGR